MDHMRANYYWKISNNWKICSEAFKCDKTKNITNLLTEPGHDGNRKNSNMADLGFLRSAERSLVRMRTGIAENLNTWQNKQRPLIPNLSSQPRDNSSQPEQPDHVVLQVIKIGTLGSRTSAIGTSPWSRLDSSPCR
jgi:hypothetical protein